MLFNFFKKHKSQNAVKEHLSEFQSEFNIQQKKAIIRSLFIIAISDGEYHRKEHRYLEQIATILGYGLNNDIKKAIDEFSTMDRDALLRNLINLDETQKDWYIVTVYGMIHADEKTYKEEFQYAFIFFEKMSISEQRIEEVIKKTELLKKI